MANVNKVILIGNLTRDPQLKYLPSQMAVAEFGLAMNRKFRTAAGEDREEVCFIDCTAWGRQGEVINQYCRKGRPLYVEGHLKLDSWEDKQGGGKRSKLTVVVENFQLLGSRDGPGGPGPDAPPAEDDQRAPARQPNQGRAPQAAKPATQEPPIGEEQHFGESDIPF